MKMQEHPIAIVYVRRPYLNPSESNLIEAFIALGINGVTFVDITCLFKEGSESLLEKALEQVRQAHCVLFSTFVFACFAVEFGHDFFSLMQGKVETFHYVKQFINTIYESSVPKIASNILFDIHDPGFAKFFQHFGKDGIAGTVRFPKTKVDDVFEIDQNAITNNRLTLEHSSAIIEVPHCIDHTEFCPADGVKIWRVAVPGVAYRRRAIAKQSIERRFTLLGPTLKPVELQLRMASKFRHATGFIAPEIKSYAFANAYHRAVLRLSEMVYTDGSNANYAIRKYYEIPAAGSLLLCTPFDGMNDFGFKDGVTHIECEPEDVGKLARTLDMKSPTIRNIVQAGQQLVREKHCAEARARQLYIALQLAAEGTLNSARWHDGEYVYD